jgi:uncharacterized BrkB/YihY/UPF0761 family membrane protein
MVREPVSAFGNRCHDGAVAAGDGPEEHEVAEPATGDGPDEREVPEPSTSSAPSTTEPRRGLVTRAKAAGQRAQAQGQAVFERNRDRPFVAVGIELYERDRAGAGTVVSSAVAFRLFLFFIPLLLFVVGIGSFLAGHVQRSDLSSAGISGSMADQIETALSQPNSTRWIAILVGLVGILTTGRTLSKTLVSASCIAWRLPVRSRASARATGAIVGLIAGLGLIAVLVSYIRDALGLAVTGLSLVAAFVVYVVAWLVVLLTLPSGSKDPSAALPGAALLGLSLVVMQAVSQLYLPDRFQRASQLYGAIGSAVVVLGWFFILGRVTVFALTVNAVVHERFGSIADFVFALPGLRVVARRSAWVRRFFELDEPQRAPGGEDREAALPPADESKSPDDDE